MDVLKDLAPLGVSILSLGVAIAAFRKSNRVAKIEIPVPVVRSASEKSVEIAMIEGTGRRFGIAEIRSKHPFHRLYERVISGPLGNRPTYEPEEVAQATTRIVCEPPTTVIIFRHPVVLGSVVRVKVKSRGDDALESWFELPVF